MTVRTRVGQATRALGRETSKQLKLRDRHWFTDRSSGAPTLVAMLIGYKPELWHVIVPGLVNALPLDSDVCLVSPGKFDLAIDEIANKHGWSYLATATNDVGLAQNIAYEMHLAAQLIVKVDEDMLLLPDSLTGTIEFFRKTQREGIVNPGYVSPLVPINGVCHREVLQAIGKLDEFEATFACARMSNWGVPIQCSAEAARWMWNATGPLAKTLEVVRSARLDPILIPIQFSIGAIVFERYFWKEFGMFPVLRHKLVRGSTTLGEDERHICKAGIHWSKPGIVCPTTIAGHFSFGSQYQGVKSLLAERPDLFVLG